MPGEHDKPTDSQVGVLNLLAVMFESLTRDGFLPPEVVKRILIEESEKAIERRAGEIASGHTQDPVAPEDCPF